MQEKRAATQVVLTTRFLKIFQIVFRKFTLQESDADLDRLEAKLKGLLLRGRGDEVTQKKKAPDDACFHSGYLADTRRRTCLEN